MKTLTEQNNFLAIESKYSEYSQAKIVIQSAPLEKTVSYGKGTGKGPKAILDASHYVEFFDEELNCELCFEKGIATLPEMKLEDDIETALQQIYESTAKLIKDDKFVVTLGGEHSLSQSPIRAYSENFSDLSILQFDAHSDLRDSYEESIYSHASIMARVAEFTKDIVQVGIRAQCKEEYDFIKSNNIKTFYAREIAQRPAEVWHKQVVDSLNENVYITFDVDAFDPSLLPATGTPEPGGLFWDETMNLLKLIGTKKNIVGFDVVELAPSKSHPASDYLAAKLVYKIMNYAFMNK
jgi:agmatinase